jgi:hypothetical protein
MGRAPPGRGPAARPPSASCAQRVPAAGGRAPAGGHVASSPPFQPGSRANPKRSYGIAPTPGTRRATRGGDPARSRAKPTAAAAASPPGRAPLKRSGFSMETCNGNSLRFSAGTSAV